MAYRTLHTTLCVRGISARRFSACAVSALQLPRGVLSGLRTPVSGKPGKRQRFLVRWKGTDASMDSWLPREQITLPALVSYEEFLQAHAKTTSDGKRASALVKARIDKYHSRFGDKGQVSAIAEQQNGLCRTLDARSQRVRQLPL